MAVDKVVSNIFMFRYRLQKRRKKRNLFLKEVKGSLTKITLFEKLEFSREIFHFHSSK